MQGELPALTNSEAAVHPQSPAIARDSRPQVGPCFPCQCYIPPAPPPPTHPNPDRTNIQLLSKTLLFFFSSSSSNAALLRQGLTHAASLLTRIQLAGGGQ